QDIPATVQHVGRHGDAVYTGVEVGGQGVGESCAVLRVSTLGKLEQIMPFGAGQMQDIGQSGPDPGRHRDVSSLFNPGVPSDANSRQLSDFLATKARSASAGTAGQAGAFWGYPSAYAAKKIA